MAGGRRETQRTLSGIGLQYIRGLAYGVNRRGGRTTRAELDQVGWHLPGRRQSFYRSRAVRNVCWEWTDARAVGGKAPIVSESQERRIGESRSRTETGALKVP